eukprot:scaffold21371_cov61-Attheya_sp.AAC.1
MLGENLQAERQHRIAREAREAAHINAAVEHYHKNQTFRRGKREDLINKTAPLSKMSWENNWDIRRVEWGKTRNNT